MQKVVELYHNKDIDMLRLGSTLLNLANICLHFSTDAKFNPFTESDEDFLSKDRENMVVGPWKVFTRKTVFDKTLIRKSKRFAIWLLESILANSTVTECFNLYLQNSAQDNFMTQICKSSSPVRTNLQASKIWLSRAFNEWDRIVQLRASTQQEIRKRLIVSMQLGFSDIETEYLKQWVVFVCSVFVMRHNLHWLKMIIKLEQEKGNFSIAETVYRGKSLHYWRSVGMWMVETLQDWCVSKRILERIFPIQASIGSKPLIGQGKIKRFIWLRAVWYQSSRTSAGNNCQLLAIYQKHKHM